MILPTSGYPVLSNVYDEVLIERFGSGICVDIVCTNSRGKGLLFKGRRGARGKMNLQVLCMESTG